MNSGRTAIARRLLFTFYSFEGVMVAPHIETADEWFREIANEGAPPLLHAALEAEIEISGTRPR